MLDLSFIRANPDLVRQAAVNRGDPAPVDRLLELDARRREAIQTEESLRERRNQLGKLMADPTQRSPDLIAEARRIGDEIKTIGTARDALESELKDLALQIPNMPEPDVPIGPDESGNVEIRQAGRRRTYDFEP